jgi:hypothetical protein
MSAGAHGDAVQERIKWLKNLKLPSRIDHLNSRYNSATVANCVVDRVVLCVGLGYVAFVLESSQ